MPLVTHLADVTYTTARWLSCAGTGAVLLLALALVARPTRTAPADRIAGVRYPPFYLRALAGADGRVSTSTTIAFAWTAVVTFVLVSLVLVDPGTWELALKNLSPTYLLLLGGPYASVVLARGAVVARLSNGTLTKTSSSDPRLGDLFTDDSGRTDIVDVQYVVFNVVAMLFVLVAFGHAGQASGFPKVPDGLLLLTAGPAGVYVANKLLPGGAPAPADPRATAPVGAASGFDGRDF